MKYHFVWLLLLATFLPSYAFAETERVIGMACDSHHNKFMLNLGVYSNENIIDTKHILDIKNPLSDQFKSIPITIQNTCHLSNGTDISVTNREGQAFIYGVGGGDPDVFFTLKIGKKTVYYDTLYYSGQSVGKASLVAVIYDGKKLYECEPTSTEEKYPYQITAVACTDVSHRLNPNENHFPPEYFKRKKLQASLSNFCKKLLKDIPAIEDGLVRNENKPVNLFKSLNEAFVSEEKIDINNDGKIDDVLRIGGSTEDCPGCGTHYFDGSYLVAFINEDSKKEDFLDFIKSNNYEVDSVENGISFLPQWNAYLISAADNGQSARYVYNVPIIREGKTYIYSFQTLVDWIPSSTISEMNSDNKLKTICEFP